MFPLEQRREDADRRPLAGREVDQGDADAHGRAVAFAGDAHQAARRLHQRVVARPVGERAGSAVGADRAVDESRIARAQRLGAEAARLGKAGAKALHEHVCLVDEAQHDVDFLREVDDERALAGVRREEQRAVPVDERRPPGASVIAVARLDLDDVGTERAEELRARRPGQRRGDVDDADAGQRRELRHRGCTQIVAGPSWACTVSAGVAPSFAATRADRVFSGLINEMRRSTPRSS